MYSQSHIRFNLLLGWCCLLSVAVMIMAAVLATGISNKSPSIGKQNGSTDAPASFDYSRGPQMSTNHIHLVSGPGEGNVTSWKHGQMCFCQNTSLLLQDNRVKITVEGFYYIYAQVSLKNNDNNNNNNKGTVTVIANENMPKKKPRKLIEAEQHGSGTVSMSGMIHLRKDDSVNLVIRHIESMHLLKDESQTHWGLFLFPRQGDY